MSTNTALRQRVLRLVNLGINQKALAARMLLSESQLSRWMRRQIRRDLPLSALDGFNGYIEELHAETALDPLKIDPAEIERLESEALAWKTEHVVKRKESAATRKPVQKKKGKGIAKPPRQ